MKTEGLSNRPDRHCWITALKRAYETKFSNSGYKTVKIKFNTV
jgi:hypothetical protein